MGLFRRKKQAASYVDLHNRAVTQYQRACRSFMWAGIVNFIGLVIVVVQHYTQTTPSDDIIPFFFCFGVSDFIFSWIEYLGIHIAWFWVIVAIITVATTAGAVLLSVYSSQGKKKVLIATAIAYGVDWVFVFLKYFIFEREGYLGLLVSAGIHIIVSFFIVMAMYQYYNVINIEKRFKNIPTVAEVKAKEEQEKQKSEEQEDEHKS